MKVFSNQLIGNRVKSLIFLFLLIAACLAYRLYLVNKTPFNVYFANINLSHQNLDVSGEIASEAIDRFEKSPLILQIASGNNQIDVIAVDKSELGISINRRQTLFNLNSVASHENLFADLAFIIKSFYVKTLVPANYTVNFDLLALELDRKLANYTTAATDASVIFGKSIELRAESIGADYDRTTLLANLADRLRFLDSAPIQVITVEVEPKVSKQNAQDAFEKAKLLDTQEIVLKFERQIWSLQGRSLLSVLDFSPNGLKDSSFLTFSTGGGTFTIKGIDYQQSEDKYLEVTVNEASIRKFVGGISMLIDRETVDATIVFEEGKIRHFTPAQNGQELDQNLTIDAISDRVSVKNVSTQKEFVINLPVIVERSKIANEEINSLGIGELIGSGVSYFKGSIANRVHNLTLGSHRISGSLVKPGENFSFNDAVGEVSGALGYKPAYVISEGRTILDDGGGICQVSTTLFRAVLNSGLPILKRTAHAYRVAYYEQGGFKAGLDATVWAPAVDFVFRNDTDQHILVQATVDKVNSRLQVDIFGTSDGRSVELSEPKISDLVPAPDDKYQDDPTLSQGITKQVDFAAAGAKSVFSRKVYRQNELIIDEEFKSNYRPWQAVYLVGTGG